MPKSITIDDPAYNLLKSLKQGPGDSFTKVILRHINRPAETAGELMDRMKDAPPPELDPDILERIMRERGRRSGGRR